MNISGDHKYIPGFQPLKVVNNNSWIFVIISKKILIYKEDGKLAIPRLKELQCIRLDTETPEYIGQYEEHDCFCIRMNEIPELPENLAAIELMEISKLSGNPDLFRLVGAANHILHWNSVNRYCGRCGSKMVEKKDERAKQCIGCGNLVYPRISPAVITAVFRGDQILLAHNRNFRTGLYSLIAGFVEPGETLEQCVKREIMEEVGIQVKNITYAGSQPWSFPDSLMMAFTAEYESGEISADSVEIVDAGWYQAGSLPDIPSTDSIAGRLIRWYIENKSI